MRLSGLDWIRLALVVLAAWYLYDKSKSGAHTPIDWPELVAVALVSQGVGVLWRNI